MRNTRLAAALLAALIWLTGSLALADGIDITIDEAFNSGIIVFRETETDWGLKDAEINIPERYWRVMNVDYMTDVELRASLQETWEEAGLPMSVSPSGTLLFLDGAAALRDGRLTLLCPNSNLGAADEYGNFASYLSLPIGRRTGNEGVVWSPDGRYFVVTNYSKALQGEHRYYYPILNDTETGDMILTAAYENTIFISACFSLDGRYLYYTVMSHHQYSLMRYELDTEKTEMCLTGEEYDIAPSPLIVLPDGSILSAALQLESLREGIMRFTENDSGWSLEFRGFPLEQAFVGGLLTDNQIIVTSSNMSWANTDFLQVIRPNEDYSGIDEYWYIDSSTLQLSKISETDLNALIDIEQSDQAVKDKRTLFKEFIGKYNLAMRCFVHALSPDGQYLLIESGDWFCVRLSDMTAVPVHFEMQDSSDRSISTLFDVGFVWTDSGLLSVRNGIGQSFFTLISD